MVEHRALVAQMEQETEQVWKVRATARREDAEARRDLKDVRRELGDLNRAMDTKQFRRFKGARMREVIEGSSGARMRWC